MMLFSVFLLMSFIAVMVLTLLSSLNAWVQVNHAMSNVHHDFYRLEAVGEHLILANNQHACAAGCITNDVNKKSAVYYYTWQDAGEFPSICLQMGEKYYTSHHWILTLYSAHTPERRLILRAATLGAVRHTNTGCASTIARGILTWRYMRTPEA